MLDKVKITITQEDGSPICGLGQEGGTVYLSENTRYFVAKKTGGTVETWSVDVSGLLELALAALDELDASAKKAICDGYGVKIY